MKDKTFCSIITCPNSGLYKHNHNNKYYCLYCARNINEVSGYDAFNFKKRKGDYDAMVFDQNAPFATVAKKTQTDSKVLINKLERIAKLMGEHFPFGYADRNPDVNVIAINQTLRILEEK